jgi:hypothetical protein
MDPSMADTEILEPIRVPAWYQRLLGWRFILSLVSLGVLLVALSLLSGCGMIASWILPRPPPAPIVKPITLEHQGVPEFLRPRSADDSSKDIQHAIADRIGRMVELKGEIASLEEANRADKRTMAAQQEERIRQVLYWVAGICILVGALTGICSFIPALTLFRGTLLGISLGAGVVGGLAIGCAPLVEYLKWVVGLAVLGAIVTGIVLLFRLHRTILSAKLNAHLADALEKIQPGDEDLLEKTKAEFATLQGKLGIGGLTERLRKSVVVNRIQDKAWKIRESARDKLLKSKAGPG